MYREMGSYSCDGRDSPPSSVAKAVRFDDEGIQIFEVINRTEITREERVASFFTDDEYNAMRLRDRAMATQLARRSSRSISSLEEDELGLETRRNRCIRRQRMNECSMSVLLEQELLQVQEKEENSHEHIADVVRDYSTHSAKLAYNRAHLNALQVHKYLSEGTSQGHFERHNFMDGPISPRSTTDPLMDDFDAPCEYYYPCKPPSQPSLLPEEKEEDNNTSMQEDILEPLKMMMVVEDFLPPHPVMMPPPPPSQTLSYCPPPPPPPTTEEIVMHRYHLLSSPPKQHPWEERWAHQYSQTQNAKSPIHMMCWYIAE